MVEEAVYLFGRHGVGILLLNARNLVCDAPVHLGGRFFIDCSERILYGILVYPNSCCEFVAVEIVE